MSFKKILPIFLLLVFFIDANVSKVQAEEALKLNVLIVFSWEKTIPWQSSIEKGFEQGFRYKKEKPNVYYEYLDAGRFKLSKHISIFRSYLAGKYASKKIDYIITEASGPAKVFVDNPDLMPGAKRIFVNPGHLLNEVKSTESMVIPVDTDYEGGAREVLERSKGKTIYLIAGASVRATKMKQIFLENILKLDPDKKVVSLVGLPMDELLEKVSYLKHDSVIFYLLIFQDGDGKRFIPGKAAAMISQRTTAPMYSLWSSLMGTGIVGGYQLSGELLGKLVATMVTNPEKINQLTHSEVQKKLYGHFYDWRQLKKWDISEKQLPPGSKIFYRQPSFYEEHLTEIIISSLIFIVFVSLFWVQFLQKEIKARKKITEEKEKLIVELKTAFDEIHTLQGIIPICSNCKNIRDDKGYWNKLEEYISNNTDTTFSHGICPDCIQKLYPDFSEEILKKTGVNNE